MLSFSYADIVLLITGLWILVRGFLCVKHRRFLWMREALLLLVWVCLVVVARFTFFPFSKVNGQIQPLLLDFHKIFPFRLNFIPFAYLLDYPNPRDALLNILGNTLMFVPIGIVWPAVFPQLNTSKKVIAAGVGFSLLIELLQLPFYDRVSDIDDLILNSLGFLLGYGIFLLARKCKRT